MKNSKKFLVSIASVKLTGGGMKGAVVEYVKQARRNSQDFLKTRKETNPEPVHGEIINLFDSLCDYLLDICCYTTAEVERKQLKNELEITGVVYGAKGFILIGQLRILGVSSKRILSLTTPQINAADGYGDYDAVVAIIEKIYAETADYMSGLKTFTNDELVLRFNKNDDEFKDVFAGLDEGAKKVMATEILEKLGSIVIHNEDMNEGNEMDMGEVVKIEKVVQNPIKQFPLKSNEVLQLNSASIEGPNFDDDNESFVFELPVVAEEEKVSTAKKKTK